MGKVLQKRDKKNDPRFKTTINRDPTHKNNSNNNDKKSNKYNKQSKAKQSKQKQTTTMDEVLKLLQEYPLHNSNANEDGPPTKYSYGTAGFRFKVHVMDGVMLRVGIVSAVLLLMTQQQGNGKYYDMGLMITASHNDESYNGVKLCQADGSMIGPEMESLLVEWVNQRSLESWKGWMGRLQSLAQSPGQAQIINPSIVQQHAMKVHMGRDTRSHSYRLAMLAKQGAESMYRAIFALDGSSINDYSIIHDHGILTTPMLHHVVLHTNAVKQQQEQQANKPLFLPTSIPIAPSREGYIQNLAKAYLELVPLSRQCVLDIDSDKGQPASSAPSPPSSLLHVDCACGVGFGAMQELISAINVASSSSTPTNTNFLSWNGPGDGPLNTNCGSEHVQKQLLPPTWYNAAKTATTTTADMNTRTYACSLDGDADRIVFFGEQASPSASMVLLDGDKIALLIARFFQNYLVKYINEHGLTMGVVQTAYANGASTNYLKNVLKIPVVITKTGVKYLHHEAMKFDIGIYFEANGHGTVLFSNKYHQVVQAMMMDSTTAMTNEVKILSLLPQLIHPAVGDALSDLLLVDVLLQALGWDVINDWSTKLYTDLPSRQVKVSVDDKSIIKVNANETKALGPDGLQNDMDKLVEAINEKYFNSKDNDNTDDSVSARCFVRPSGTENVVRVYAEAPTRILADQLAVQVEQLVLRYCNDNNKDGNDDNNDDKNKSDTAAAATTKTMSSI